MKNTILRRASIFEFLHSQGQNQTSTGDASKSAKANSGRRILLVVEHGYPIVVDGHFKTEFIDEIAAMKVATELLTKYPKLKIEIYDAST